jgi:hypothetical protein
LSCPTAKANSHTYAVGPRNAGAELNADGWHKPGAGNVDPQHDKDRDGRDDRAEGAATGGGLCAIAGGVAGVAASLGLLAIPGVGPVVTIWWLATLVAGAVAGGATGGIIGALVESGVSRENAEIKDEAFRRGGAIVSAKVPDDEDARYTTILSNAAINEATRAAAYRASGRRGYDPAAAAYSSAEHARKEREAYTLAESIRRRAFSQHSAFAHAWISGVKLHLPS